MKDNLCQSNPFGVLSAEALLSFENAIGTKLPTNYREYLSRHNGGGLPDEYFVLPGDRQESFKVGTIFGLHAGPIASQLQENYSILSPDGGAGAELGFITVGITTTGEPIVLNLENDNLLIFMRKYGTSPHISNISRPRSLAPNFSIFMDSLVSFDCVARAHTTDQEIADFYERLRKAKENRARHVARILSGDSEA